MSVNLLRELRNARDFEYAGEDALLAVTMIGEQDWTRGASHASVLVDTRRFFCDRPKVIRTGFDR